MSETVEQPKLGIDAIKGLLGVLFSTHEAVEKAKANDGKIDLNDAPLLMEPGMRLFPMLGQIEQVVPQFKDLDDAEKQELLVWAKADYDIADDKLEAKVEAAMEIIVKASVFFS